MAINLKNALGAGAMSVFGISKYANSYSVHTPMPYVSLETVALSVAPYTYECYEPVLLAAGQPRLGSDVSKPESVDFQTAHDQHETNMNLNLHLGH